MGTESLEWITVSNSVSSMTFKDSCLTPELKIVTVDLTDSIIYLKDKCEKRNLAIIAAKYEYPDGSLNIRSKISNDTILTISIGEYIGAYEEKYYELLIDSVTTRWTINNRISVQLSKDSTRITKTIKL
ncbi:MAG: hypothetical protein V7655_11165 [Aequorivita antarctica]